MKKLTKMLAAILVMVLVISGFTACEPKSPSKETVYYTVTFDLGGGTIEGKDLSSGLQVESGTVLKLADYVPVKDNYDFTGWKVGETEYSSTAQLTVEADITLKAQWSEVVPDVYTVTFDANGGTMEQTEIEVEDGTCIALSEYIPEKEGFIFVGWLDGDGNLYAQDAEFVVTDNVMFTAQWKAEPTAAENFVFTLNADENGYVLSKLADGFAVEKVVVPGEYDGKPVTEIANSVFSYNDTVKSIDLSNCKDLLTIGDYNFYNCASLTSVNLEGCSALKELGRSCFNNVTALITINLNGLTSLETIGSTCFYGYSDSTALPAEELDFTDCVSLKSIGQMSLWYLTEVKVLDFSNTKITGFERQNIKNCPSLEVVKLPATLEAESIDSEFITDCDNLKEIVVHSDSLYLTVENGVLYDIDKTQIIKYPAQYAASGYTAPATIIYVRSQAFKNAKNLTSIDFSETVLEKVEYQAFDGCENAELKVPFDENYFYLDGSKASCDSNWNRGVKNTVYGERYMYFTFAVTGLTDGMSVTDDTLSITATATYGDDNCIISVTVNGQVVSGENGSYVLQLQAGENTVVIRAEFGENSDERTYIVNKVGKAEIKTDLNDGMQGDTVTFKVWVEDADGQRQDISDLELKLTFAWSRTSTSFSPILSYLESSISISYNAAEKCYEVSIDYSTIYWNYFEDVYRIKMEFEGSAYDSLIRTLEYENA